MQQYNIRGDNYTYSKLIKSLIDANMIEDACSICQDSFANKVRLNSEIYNMLLSTCAYSDDSKLMR